MKIGGTPISAPYVHCLSMFIYHNIQRVEYMQLPVSQRQVKEVLKLSAAPRQWKTLPWQVCMSWKSQLALVKPECSWVKPPYLHYYPTEKLSSHSPTQKNPSNIPWKPMEDQFNTWRQLLCCLFTSRGNTSAEVPIDEIGHANPIDTAAFLGQPSRSLLTGRFDLMCMGRVWKIARNCEMWIDFAIFYMGKTAIHGNSSCKHTCINIFKDPKQLKNQEALGMLTVAFCSG